MRIAALKKKFPAKVLDSDGSPDEDEESLVEWVTGVPAIAQEADTVPWNFQGDVVADPSPALQETPQQD